ncbi:MAG: SMC-Scp complex subunit ScpB, partial [Acidobacteriota bacterium]
MPLVATIESLLFVSTKPLTARRLADIVGASEKEVEEALAEIMKSAVGRGFRLIKS